MLRTSIDSTGANATKGYSLFLGMHAHSNHMIVMRISPAHVCILDLICWRAMKSAVGSGHLLHEPMTW